MTRVVTVTGEPSDRLLRACAAFGLRVRRGDDASRRAAAGRAATELDLSLGPGGVGLVVGPSGAGKSTILGALRRRLGERCRRVVDAGDAPVARRRPLVDLVDMPLDAALSLLTRAGLTDPTLLARSPAELSVGQLARWRIAWAMAEASGAPSTLLVDELGSSLDAPTARAAGAMLARWVRSAPHRLVAATTRDDLDAVMGPDVLWPVALGTFGVGGVTGEEDGRA